MRRWAPCIEGQGSPVDHGSEQDGEVLDVR